MSTNFMYLVSEKLNSHLSVYITELYRDITCIYRELCECVIESCVNYIVFVVLLNCIMCVFCNSKKWFLHLSTYICMFRITSDWLKTLGCLSLSLYICMYNVHIREYFGWVVSWQLGINLTALLRVYTWKVKLNS